MARRVQARITLPAALRGGVDALRVRWNPEVAAGNPAHVTVVYHDEAPDEALLRARLERACAQQAPFAAVIGGLAEFAQPLCGAFLAVADPSGGIEALRASVLAPPFRARDRFGLHLTLLHPAHGTRLAAARAELAALAPVGSFEVARIDLVTGTGRETETLASFPLGG